MLVGRGTISIPLQVNPLASRAYPGSQSHWKDPLVLVQVWVQTFLSMAHSSTSAGKGREEEKREEKGREVKQKREEDTRFRGEN